MRYVMFLAAWIYSLSCLGQQFKYEIKEGASGVALYTLIYDSTQQLAYLHGANIHLEGRFYPVSYAENLESAISYGSSIPIESKFYEMLSVVKERGPFDNLLLAKSFADSSNIQSVDSLKDNWILIEWMKGGEVYEKKEEEFIRDSVKVFYVSFAFEGDILLLYEDTSWNFSMCCGWFCSGSYKYTDDKSDPTAFLLKLKSDWALTKEQMAYFDLASTVLGEIFRCCCQFQ